MMLEADLGPANDVESLLTVKDLRVGFPVARGIFSRSKGLIWAVDGVSFDLNRGETLALVGESGSGKTTVGRAVVCIRRPDSGSIMFAGNQLANARGRNLRRMRRQFQMIFQDPYSSLDPRQTVGSLLAEPLRIHDLGKKAERNTRVADLLRMVGLNATASNRYPHEFSGGQRQRISIARALAVEPQLIVCDEPISSLDVSIRAQIVNLLMRLQAELGLTYLFIAHDLAVVRKIADRVAVMYLGKLVEVGVTEVVYNRPAHPYTKALLSAVPVPDVAIERSRVRIVLSGEIPRADKPPSGCRFHPRCWLRQKLGNPEICSTTEPPLGTTGNGQLAACHFASETSQGRTLGNE